MRLWSLLFVALIPGFVFAQDTSAPAGLVTPEPAQSDTVPFTIQTDDTQTPVTQTSVVASASGGRATNDIPPQPLSLQEDSTQTAVKFLRDGGPSIWAIAALSVVTLALILWKIWRLALIGAWSRGKAG